jgi:diguanylate cyclase (GGDEF)-like protein
MNSKCILILNPSAAETERLSALGRSFGEVVSAESVEGIAGRLPAAGPAVAVLDTAVASFQSLKRVLPAAAAVILTGPDEAALRQTAAEWPSSYYIDRFISAAADPGDRAFGRALERAMEAHRLRTEVESLRENLTLQEAKVRDVYAEIQEIKGLINTNFIQEIEKRVAIEAKYVWFQRERERFEAILRKIYGADDVSSLLDLVPDIRDIVHASSATVYIIEESETQGRYLKPVVWDNAFLTHLDFSKFIAPLDAQDFAATVARYGHAVNVSGIGSDPRLTRRYTECLKTPPTSLLAVPIMHDRKVIGVVEVYNKTDGSRASGEGFNREDQQILQSLSEHIAIAMTKLNLIQYDALTGLLRPDPFFEKVLQKINALSQRRREEGGLALVMGDVDWFKTYNDRNGQEAGNRLLRELAHVLKMSIREEDLICRYGGEEFLIFLAGLKDPGAAGLLTERIRKNVEDHYFECQEFQPGRNLTMSFGVTVFPSKDGESAAPLTLADLKRLAGEADLAMAEAKGKRRPQIKFQEGAEPVATKNRVSIYRGAAAAKAAPVESPPPVPRVHREKRKYERTNVSTFLVFRDDGGFKVAKTANLSLEGARIVSDARLPLAKTIDTIVLLGERANVCKSDVIYSSQAEDEADVFYTGLRFRDQTYKDIKSLDEYLGPFRKKVAADA